MYLLRFGLTQIALALYQRARKHYHQAISMLECSPACFLSEYLFIHPGGGEGVQCHHLCLAVLPGASSWSNIPQWSQMPVAGFFQELSELLLF